MLKKLTEKQKKIRDAKWKELEESLGKAKLSESVNNIIFSKKQKIMKQGVTKGRHYYSSTNKDDSFDSNLLHEFKLERLKELNKKNKAAEEIKKFEWKEEVYKFKGKKKKKK